MLEKIIKTFRNRIIPTVLAGSILISSACSNKIDETPNQVQPQQVVQIDELIEEEPIINYDEMTWEEVIEYVETPQQAQIYLDEHFIYEEEELMLKYKSFESFRLNHEDGTGVCIDYAIAVAALLSDDHKSNNETDYIVCLYPLEGPGHAVYMYKDQNELCYAVGNTPVVEGEDSPTDLIERIGELTNTDYVTYILVPLDTTYPEDEWLSGDVMSLINIIPLRESRI